MDRLKSILFNKKFSFIQLGFFWLVLLGLEVTLWKDFTSLRFLNSYCDLKDTENIRINLLFLTAMVKYSLFAGLLWLIFNGKRLYLDLHNIKVPFRTHYQVFTLSCFHFVAFILMAALNGYKEDFCVFKAPIHPNTLFVAFLSLALIYATSTLLIFAPSAFWIDYYKKNLKKQSLLMIFMWTLAYQSSFNAFEMTFIEQQLHDVLFPITAALVLGILHLLNFVTLSNIPLHQITLNEFAVEITPKCLGYEGVVIGLLVLSVYFFYNRHRLNFPNILLIYPLITLFLFPWVVPTYVTGLLWGFMWQR